MTPVRIVLVDDHRVVAHSLKAYLESFPDLRVVGIAASGEELLEHLAEWRPQVVLQDLLLPGAIDGIETTRRIRARDPLVRVVALTASTDEARMIAVLRAGASGYVRKDAEPDLLLAAVRAVAGGERYVEPSRVAAVLHAVTQEALTARESEVLRHVALGRANKEIGRALGVSEETVKTHVAHLLAKLDVGNRSQAIAQALRRGLISIDDLDS